jgi:acyl-coenzyme A thioesterase PaaI-like protein
MHLFEIDGDHFVPTGLTRGPWDPGFMNGGAVSALCARAAELHDGGGADRSDRQLVARLTVDLVRPAPLAPLTVRTSVVRPGRKVQLVAIEIVAGEQTVARASALRMRTMPLPLPQHVEDAAPPFLSAPARLIQTDDAQPYFHSHALDMRSEPGRPVSVWARMTCDVVSGEATSPQQRAAAIADMGSGMSPVVPFTEWQFPNVDVDLHLHRLPRGEWLNLTTVTQAGDDGIGMAVAAMSDMDGRCGQVVQSVLLERRDLPVPPIS